MRFCIISFPFPPGRELPFLNPHDPPGDRQLGEVKEREMRTPPAPPWTLGALGKLPGLSRLPLAPWREPEWVWRKLCLEVMVPSVGHSWALLHSLAPQN